MSRGVGGWVLVLVFACGGPEPTLEDNFGVIETLGTEGCDNLLPDCLYPYPSEAYVTEDGLALPDPVLATRRATFHPDELNRSSAFGAASPIVFQLPGAEAPGPGPFDSAASLAEDFPTLVIDASTGERIPHWVETDFLSPRMDPPLLVIRTAVPLPRGGSIVVGVRGLAVETPAAFAALRDGTASEWIGIHDRRAHYESVVFPTLEAAGAPRDSLVLAWSFPVTGEAEATAPLLSARDAIFDALPASGPEYAIDSIIDCDGVDDPDGCHPSIRVILDGTVSVPSVVLPPDDLGVRRLRVDAEGRPVVEGVEVWPFRLQLPHAAFTGDAPVPVLQYGHGFLGRRAEADNGWIRDMADRLGFAILATNMQGMDQEAQAVWGDVLLMEGGRFPTLKELAFQGVVNQLVQQRMVKTSLAESAETLLHREGGELAWDPTTVWYYGNSQGGSVGTVVMALSLDVERGVLGVPGSGYPLLLHRSVDFDPFAALLGLTYPSADAVPAFLATLGTGWDNFDPLTFAPYLTTDPLPGTPAHQVLFHVAKEDREVVNEASFISARAAGAVLMVPAVRPVFGLEEVPYPASPAAAVVEVDFGIPDDPTPLDPPDGDPSQVDEGNTHGWLRRFRPAQDQMVHFLRTGEMIDVCGGEPCVTDGRPEG